MMRLFTVLLFCCATVSGQAILERGKPRVYTGEHLTAIGLPIGGVGTGNIWINGKGELSVWQIFNNMNETGQLPLSRFVVRAKEKGGNPLVRYLGPRALELPAYMKGLKVNSFRGDYPFGWLEFEQGELPVKISLEVFNPMIPLNLADSSLPCAIFRLTAKNVSDKSSEVSLVGLAQNGVGYAGKDKVDKDQNDGFGGNQNVLVGGDGYRAFHMSIPNQEAPGFHQPVELTYQGRRNRALDTCQNLTVKRIPQQGPLPPTKLLWLDGMTAESDPRCFSAMATVAAKGGHILLTNTKSSLYDLISSVKKQGFGNVVVYEDFEGKDYGKWEMTGSAFGKGPARGTLPHQQKVTGFSGQGLVNTFNGRDRSTGTLTSPPFKIRHLYIGFLIGGGAHRDMTCINLKVAGKTVATKTGRNNELLQSAQWDVGKWQGREAKLEIVDNYTGSWGHINIDRIVFSDFPPVSLLGREDALRRITPDFPVVTRGGIMARGYHEILEFSGGRPCKQSVRLTGKGAINPVRSTDPLQTCVGYHLGKAKLILSWHCSSSQSLAHLAKHMGIGFQAKSGLPLPASRYGTMAFGVLDPNAQYSADYRRVHYGNNGYMRFVKRLLATGSINGDESSSASPLGRSLNCALSVPFTLAPGESRTVTFVHAWSFPNLKRYGHEGNLYAKRFPTAAKVVDYVCTNFTRLAGETRLYHDTLYETNLPYWLLDCLSSQSCIPRTVLCFHAAKHKATGKPYFAGYEGCYGCCPLNCTHVWNYAQTHARLFPGLGRNLRWYDFNHYLKPTGEHQHRQHRDSSGFIDGHCAVITGAYREHLTSPDNAFLTEIWPGVKKATEWLIKTIDPDEDGVNGSLQWNTYDVQTGGAHTFIGSQYLSALAAAGRMAGVMGDQVAASRWEKIGVAGSKNQDKLLWSGEYYIQKPDKKAARDYNTGCHSDQLLGQWWANMLDTGQLYPKEHVLSALRAVYKHNFKANFMGFHQRPRRYALDNEGGLLMCTWPHGGRPDPFILYADEVWTGIEYSTAGLMIYEGMLEEAFTIVKTARDRYDGKLRAGLNSGPGGNPFCELECGRFYARALSSWSLLLAAQGFIYDGPQKTMGFLPRWRPHDHKSFFTAAKGWGLFTQKQQGKSTQATIQLQWGTLALAQFVLARQTNQGPAPVLTVKHRGKTIPAILASPSPNRWHITLSAPLVLRRGETMVVMLGAI